VLAIDQSKAFDSVSNRFMREVYKFFGFGPKFIKIMETLGNNRNACIILDNGEYSENFNLEKGRPQGDPPSPLQYNLAEQILLFKLELDPGIERLIAIERNADPVAIENNAAPAVRTYNRDTSNSDAYADDTTLCVPLTMNNMTIIKNILTEFGRISGLKCNIEKSHIMRVGSRPALENEILALGFAETDSVTVLGLNIDYNLNCLQECHDLTLRKIERLALFWSRFNLS